MRFATKTVIDGRGTDTYNESHLLEYDANGHLAAVYIQYDTTEAEGGKVRGERRIALTWTDSQVNRIVVHQAQTWGLSWEPERRSTSTTRTEYTPT